MRGRAWLVIALWCVVTPGCGDTSMCPAPKYGWYALGDGVDFSVYSLATDPGGELLAAGLFDGPCDSTTHCMARWNGERWANPWFCFKAIWGWPTIMEMMAYGPFVAAVGSFTRINAREIQFVSLWDGTDWQLLAVLLSAPRRS